MDKNIDILKHMSKYCSEILDITLRFGRSFEDFSEDSAYQYAVSMCVLQIGELSAHLTDEFRKQYNEIPWRAIKAMRNLFVHNYSQMNEKRTWDTIVNDIPPLKSFCDKILAQFSMLEQDALDVDYDDEEDEDWEQ